MRAAVLGQPVAHSLSPVLHRSAYAALGLSDWSYDLVECAEDDLASYVDSRDAAWAGLSLTMPLKRAVLPLLDHADSLAVATGGANTVVFRPEGRYGYNTDVQGIVDALTEAGVTAGVPGRVLILGAGATACSALAAIGVLGGRGADVAVRDAGRAGGLTTAAERLGLRANLVSLEGLTENQRPDLLISTLPAGAADNFTHLFTERPVAPAPGQPSGSPSAGKDLTASAGPVVLFDVVYSPWPTRLAQSAEAAGARVVGGFAMLLHQAAAQVELMTGEPAPLEAMRVAGEAELARRTVPSQ
ncbi:MAG TPA: shikimate dehydrogenase [Trebonia sp.]|jgi:shikimate dehydrogenase